jgi:hypothetical protein
MKHNPTSRWPVVSAALWLVVTVLLPAAVSAQTDDGPKPTGFRVLTIGGGARAVALGEAMAADGRDPFIIEYNPAGLVKTERFTVAFAHNEYFLDTRGDYVVTTVPINRWAFGARVGFVGTSDIPHRIGPSDNPLSFYDAADGVFQAALAGPVDERLSVGLSAAWVVEHIDIETAQSVVLGFGVLYELHDDLSFGASFVNVGPPAKFVTNEFKMPNLLRLGGRWMTGPVSTLAELVAGDDGNVKWHLGGEYIPDPRLALRAGLRLGYDTQWMAAGFGAYLPSGRLGIDYAFAPYTDDFGSTHRFGLVIRP